MMPPTRADLSPYIVHLTRDYKQRGGLATKARDNLLRILREQCIDARNPYGVAVRRLEALGCTGRRSWTRRRWPASPRRPWTAWRAWLIPASGALVLFSHTG
jgi:hypothetical protein